MIGKCFILAGKLMACLSSTSDLPISDWEIMQMEAHLPGLQATPLSPQTPDVLVNHVESDQFALDQNKSHITIHEAWHGKLSPDFVHMFYGAARLNWLNKGLFPIHGACVGQENDGYILLVGHPGVGKTTATLQSSQTYHLKVFSGDKTLIRVDEDGTMEALGGTRALTIRLKDLDRWPGLKGLGMEKGDRYVFRLKDDQYASTPTVKIKAIVLIQFNEGFDHFSQLSSLSSVHTLYPYFMDFERGDVLLDGGKAMMIGSISPEVKKKYIPTLSESIKKIPTYKLSGSVNFVMEKIYQLSQKAENQAKS